jgi:hypothetical protein
MRRVAQLIATLLIACAHISGSAARLLPPTLQATQTPEPIAYYPLKTDLNDAAGNNPPMQAANAPFVAGGGIFCNGEYRPAVADACDVRTPELAALSSSAFTISVQFLAPGRRFISPVFVLGQRSRWLYYELRHDARSRNPGSVRIGYGNGKYEECTVKYRPGVWHEAAITFDGRIATLYLDGAGGCSANVPLSTPNTLNEKVLLLTNFGNASSFYGVLRELKVYDRVIVPARRAPEAALVTLPEPSNPPPVDLFLARCPSSAQLAAIDKDIRIAFDTDPTSGDPLACSKANGSRDLSPFKKRVYNTLLVAKELKFDQPLPWTRETLYAWFVKTVRGIRFRGDIEVSSCCSAGPTINMAANNLVPIYTERWVERSVGNGLKGLLTVLVHEARHVDGGPHLCGGRDNRLEDMGSWSAVYYLERWLGEHADKAFFSSTTIDYTPFARREAERVLKSSFASCRP